MLAWSPIGRNEDAIAFRPEMSDMAVGSNHLHDRTAVVTGAAAGIGEALARKLVSKGINVVINDLDSHGLNTLASELGATAIPGDAADNSSVTTLVHDARSHLGSIDMWFANAGIDRGRGLDMSEDDWTASIEVNVLAHVRAARLLMPEWIERGRGRFVVTASAAGLLTMIDAPAYTVSKHGAVAFAEWLSATYRHRGITVQAICPQGVTTRMLEESGLLKDLLTHDTAIAPDQVADAAWDALSDERFLILPHPEVSDYYKTKAQNLDDWLSRMNRIQQHIERRREQPHEGMAPGEAR